MQVYPEDSIETAIRNVFDFDVYKRDTMRALLDILEHHRQVTIIISRKCWVTYIINLKIESSTGRIRGCKKYKPKN